MRSFFVGFLFGIASLAALLKMLQKLDDELNGPRYH